MGHMRYLPMDHPWRRNKRAFDGTQKRECAPDVQSDDDILGQLEGMVFGDESAGKQKRRSGRLDNRHKLQLTMSCGKRKVFSFGCRTGNIIYCGITLMSCT
jgi:hypothetical protein